MLIFFLSFNVICLLLLAATTLTGMHFATTTLMTVVLRMLGYVQPSHLPLPDLLKFVCVSLNFVDFPPQTYKLLMRI